MSLRQWIAVWVGTLGVSLAVAGQRVGEPSPVQVMADGSSVVTGMRRVTFRSRPVDAATSPDAKWVAVKDNVGVKLFAARGMKAAGEWKSNDGMSAVGITFQGSTRVWVTTGNKFLVGLDVSPQGKLSEAMRIDLGDSYPNGLVIAGSRAFVALSTKNHLAEVDLETGRIARTLSTEAAPFTLAAEGDRLYVACQGGAPASGAASAKSAGTGVSVDERGVLTAASVVAIDRVSGQTVARADVGTLPSSILVDARRRSLLVACANSDTVEEWSLATLKPTSKVSFDRGSAPTGLVWSGNRPVVALAGQNRVARLVRSRNGWSVQSTAPTDWFPVAVVVSRGEVWAVCTKGLGSRSPERAGSYNSYDYKGSLTQIGVHWQRAQRASRSVIKSLPPVKHVVYVIKENRTYDQVFGDLPQGDGDPRLCQFGEMVTPNQHALARRWVLLDNYYCSGVLSADGHSWATEGNSTPYLERSFGAFKRSYTFGDDPLTYSQTGFLWDGLLAKGLTFRNYGEFDYAESADKLPDAELYRKSLSGVKLSLNHSIGVQRVRDHSCAEYPGWNMAISDQYRIDRFLEDFQESKRNGEVASLSVVYLPQDHTGGPVSPTAHVADNDLAVGRLVEALSHSQFWKDTLVFVTEDDPQAGTDHVDGHRSTCLVIGPYVKRGAVVSHFFSQASVLHTIDALFGVPAPTLKTAIAPVFRDVWADTPDLTPYSAIKPVPSLTATVPPGSSYYAFVARLDLRRREVQSDAEMDALNRAVWASVRPGEQYPAEWAGAHGRGLAKKGLKLDRRDVAGDED